MDSALFGINWRKFQRTLFPGVCLICDTLLSDVETRICQACQEAIGNDPHYTCPRCTSNVGQFESVTDGCPRCRDLAPPLDAALRLGVYEGRLREAVLRLKVGSGEPLGVQLGHCFGRWRSGSIRPWHAEMLVPVPLHWWRRWARGYNQSEAIAEGLSDSLGIPVRSGVLKRIRWTKKQAELSATQRYENIHGAFAIRDTEGIRGKRIALVDDVLTTGGTLSECARILRQAGAKWVGALVLAHR